MIRQYCVVLIAINCTILQVIFGFKSLSHWQFLLRQSSRSTYNTERNLKVESNPEPQSTWQKIALTEPTESTSVLNLSQCNLLKSSIEIPLSTLRGKYIINGLSTCRVGDVLVHPFEAHGFIKSVEFHGNNTASFKTKHVQTFCTSVERKLNRPLWRGVMSTIFSQNGPLAFLNMFFSRDRNTANLACRFWPPTNEKGNQILIVGGDNGDPYVLDINTLESKGKLCDQPGYQMLTGKKFLAHTRYDAKRGRLILLNLEFLIEKPGDPGKVLLRFFEYDKDHNLISETPFITDEFVVMHDWTITDNYYVITQNPAIMQWNNLFQFIVGMKRGVDVFRTAPEKNGSILLIPRHHEDKSTMKDHVIQAKSDSFFNIFHIGPTFEEPVSTQVASNSTVMHEKVKQLVLYGVVFDAYSFGNEMGFDVHSQSFDPSAWSTSADAAPPRLDKFVVDLVTHKIVSRTRIPLMSSPLSPSSSVEADIDIPVDMPTCKGNRDGLQSSYVYFTGGRPPPDGWFPFRYIVKTDLQSMKTQHWDAGDGRVVAEPMFIPFPSATADDDDNGYVFSILNNAKDSRCELAIFNAKEVGDGPVALLDLGNLAPWSVHGSWLPN